MKTGDLVTYKRKDPLNKFSDQIGVIVGKCPNGLGDWFIVQWATGSKFAENRRFLKLVKK